jgi:hypothetical protein
MLKRSTEMSKPMTITPAAMMAMIDEIHESVTAVSWNTASEVAQTVRDSLHEDCTNEYGEAVTDAMIVDVVNYWIGVNDGIIDGEQMRANANEMTADLTEEPEVYGDIAEYRWIRDTFAAVADRA